MKRIGIHIRDTFIKFEQITEEIQSLIDEFNSIGYIDFRTEMGNDQIRRLTDSQRKRIEKNFFSAIEIENKIKALLLTDDEKIRIKKEEELNNKNKKINRIKNRINQIESYCSRQINSSRMNATKKEYLDLKEELLSI